MPPPRRLRFFQGGLNGLRAIRGRAAFAQGLLAFGVGFGPVKVHHVEDIGWPVLRRADIHLACVFPGGAAPQTVVDGKPVPAWFQRMGQGKPEGIAVCSVRLEKRRRAVRRREPRRSGPAETQAFAEHAQPAAGRGSYAPIALMPPRVRRVDQKRRRAGRAADKSAGKHADFPVGGDHELDALPRPLQGATNCRRAPICPAGASGSRLTSTDVTPLGPRL